MPAADGPEFPFNRMPIRLRRGIPFYVDKSPAAFRADPYEQYDPMVVRQTAVHLVADWWTRYPFQDVLDWCLARLPATSLGNALEIGCGVGRFIGEIARARPEWSCVGLDYSYQLLRQADRYWRGEQPIEIDGRDRGFSVTQLAGFCLPNVQFALADAVDLPIQTGSVDWIVASFVLDRLTDPATALSDWARVLRPGGRLLLILPYNFQRTHLWEQWYPPVRFTEWLKENNWRIAEQRHFAILEPMDGHGNALHWRTDGYLLTRA